MADLLNSSSTQHITNLQFGWSHDWLLLYNYLQYVPATLYYLLSPSQVVEYLYPQIHCCSDKRHISRTQARAVCQVIWCLNYYRCTPIQSNSLVVIGWSWIIFTDRSNYQEKCFCIMLWSYIRLKHIQSYWHLVIIRYIVIYCRTVWFKSHHQENALTIILITVTAKSRSTRSKHLMFFPFAA